MKLKSMKHIKSYESIDQHDQQELKGRQKGRLLKNELVKIKRTGELVTIIDNLGGSDYFIEAENGARVMASRDKLERTTPEEKEFYYNTKNYNL
jgi:hypothetical protein